LFLSQTRLNLTEVRNLHIELLWNMTQSLNVLHPDVWEQLAQAILDNYTQEVYDAKIYFDIHADIHEKKPEWKFGEALLYSITVITTIGQLAFLLLVRPAIVKCYYSTQN